MNQPRASLPSHHQPHPNTQQHFWTKLFFLSISSRFTGLEVAHDLAQEDVRQHVEVAHVLDRLALTVRNRAKQWKFTAQNAHKNKSFAFSFHIFFIFLSINDSFLFAIWLIPFVTREKFTLELTAKETSFKFSLRNHFRHLKNQKFKAFFDQRAIYGIRKKNHF